MGTPAPKTLSGLDAFERSWLVTLGTEGVLSMDPSDKGNWTTGRIGMGELRGSKYGISAASFPDEDIRNLTLARARTIAKVRYWDEAACDSLEWPLSMLVFDMSYNSGSGNAKTVLQASLNVAQDGKIGRLTMAAINAKSKKDLVIDYLAERLVFMSRIESWPVHRRGWSRRVITLAIEAVT